LSLLALCDYLAVVFVFGIWQASSLLYGSVLCVPTFIL